MSGSGGRIRGARTLCGGLRGVLGGRLVSCFIEYLILVADEACGCWSDTKVWEVGRG